MSNTIQSRPARAAGRITALLLVALFVTTVRANAPDTLPRKPQLGAALQALSADERAASKLGDRFPGALKVNAVLPKLTAEAAGLAVGDIVLTVDGAAPPAVPQLVPWVGEHRAGTPVAIEVLRDGKPVKLSANWVERLRQPDNDAYRVRYESVPSRGDRIRTIVTVPAALKTGERAPAMFFIQGAYLGSLDLALTGPDAYSQIIDSFARRGFVTVRVDKAGVGDSEGGLASAVDFERETDAFRAALKATFARPEVDPKRVLIFGHSMGGLQAPILAGELPVKAVVAVATVYRPWYEYVLENSRRQLGLAGATGPELDDAMRREATVQHRYLIDRQTPEAIAQQYPAWREALAQEFPVPGQWSGRAHAFWQQVAAASMPQAWDKVGARVLALWGDSEFVASEVDHPLLVEAVNRKHPGSARYLRLPNSDHGFNQTKDMADSFQVFGEPGAKFNPNVIAIVHDWLRDTAF